MTPKNLGIAQKGTQISGNSSKRYTKTASNPKKYPKNPRIMTYASYSPEYEHKLLWMNSLSLW